MNYVKNVEQFLESSVSVEPEVLLNIGVGPRPHFEAQAFKNLWPNIEIIGLEPNAQIFQDRIVDYPGRLYPWALWSSPSIQQLKIPHQRPGLSSILCPNPKWKRYVEYDVEKKCTEILVSCVTLDQLDEALNYPSGVFLWMDIEGAELEAINGGHTLLNSGRVLSIDLEISNKPRRIGEPYGQDIHSALKNCGFSIKQEHGVGMYFQNVLYWRDS